MRAQKTIKKLLKKLQNPETRSKIVFNDDEVWGMIYMLKWILNFDLSELMKEVDARILERRNK